MMEDKMKLDIKYFLPITVRLTREFLVGADWKNGESEKLVSCKHVSHVGCQIKRKQGEKAASTIIVIDIPNIVKHGLHAWCQDQSGIARVTDEGTICNHQIFISAAELKLTFSSLFVFASPRSTVESSQEADILTCRFLFNLYVVLQISHYNRHFNIQQFQCIMERS